MGNRNQNEKKHLVIVGASFGGLILLDKIKNDFNVTIIDKKDHFEWIWSMPQSVMDLDYFNDHATIDLKKWIEEDRVFGDHAQFVQGMLSDISSEKSIKIKRTDSVEESKSLNDIPEEIINFDYLVICTGSHYIANETTAKNVASLYSKEQRYSFLKRYQTEIDNANSILIVGGGATGTEFLGEIQRKYGTSKTYGLITNQKELLVGFPQSARTKALNHFTNSGVKIYTEQRFYHDSDLDQEYDFVLMCMGQSFYTPFMDNSLFSDWKDKKGRIYVNEYFQVTNQPKNEEVQFDKYKPIKVFENILCYGDACLSPGFVNNVPTIRVTSYTVAKNLKALAYGGKLERSPLAIDLLAGVYFSKYSGTTIFNDFALSFWLTLAGKKFIEGTFMNKYKNRWCSKCRYGFYNWSVNWISCVCNKIWCCCSWSYRKQLKERRKILQEIMMQDLKEDKKKL